MLGKPGSYNSTTTRRGYIEEQNRASSAYTMILSKERIRAFIACKITTEHSSVVFFYFLRMENPYLTEENTKFVLSSNAEGF